MARFLVTAALIAALAACNDSPVMPSGGSSGGGGGSSTCNVPVGPQGCALGLIIGTIAGSSFTGGVPAGGAVFTPVAAQGGRPAQDFIVIQGTSSDFRSLMITTKARIGTTSLGSGTIDSETGLPTIANSVLTVTANGALAGTWAANVNGGSGSVTLTSISPSGATGSFILTLAPQPGSGAVGNRSATGTFSVTF